MQLLWVCNLTHNSNVHISNTYNPSIIKELQKYINLCKLIGWPIDIYDKIMADPTTRMIIKEVGCQLSVDFKSDALPKEAVQGEKVFKFGEEFEWNNPFDPTDKLKV